MADYKATAAELASIANAIRLKGGTSAALEYPTGWITAIQNLVPASGGSEITPADPTAEYKVTDSELISIANAIRAKGGTSSQLEFPSEFVSAIQNIPAPAPPIEIVSWATGTDEEIVAMIQAAHNGDIDLQTDGGWAVGDVRTISISAFVGYQNVNFSAQDVDLVITSFDEYNSCGNVLQFDFKDALAETDYLHYYTGAKYDQTGMYTSTLPALVNALPTWLKDCLIEFTANSNYDGSNYPVSGNKLACRSTKELFNSSSGEIGTQLDYYKTQNNRVKNQGKNGSAVYWWTRNWGRNYYPNVTDTGTGSSSGRMKLGVAPFGCI